MLGGRDYLCMFMYVCVDILFFIILHTHTCIIAESSYRNAEARRSQKMSVQLPQEQMRLFPALSPLVLFLKLFLSQRNLHETFMGGMGSYVLVCAPWMCWCHRFRYFACHPKREKEEVIKSLFGVCCFFSYELVLFYYDKLQHMQVVLSFLQHHKSAQSSHLHSVTTLGNLLLDFFRPRGSRNVKTAAKWRSLPLTNVL